MAKKIIGISCDRWKAKTFRNGLNKDGFNLVYDNGLKQIHVFKIECEEKDFEATKTKLQKTLTLLEIKCKQSN